MDRLTSLLDRTQTPAALRRLSPDELPRLAAELRAEVIAAAAETGGHFGGGLGVVELTVALHYVFDTPADRLIWDVSHQAYPHKILTGRRHRIRSIRQRGGLYGFTQRAESPYDPFGAAHSSTSISAGLGMALARDFSGGGHHVIAVIGDGALSGGMAYEAMNHAGSLSSRLIVILNDNGMSIAPAVGALDAHLRDLRQGKMPSLFEGLGFRHEGPVDGHDVRALVNTLTMLRNAPETGPVLLHVVTEKGRGHPFQRPDRERYHAVPKFDPVTLEFMAAKSNTPSFTQVFADSLVAAARNDDKVVAITAAMPSGTGLDIFAEHFPKRCFDVGIAEQHAVTMAAGLAAEGMKPVCAIYSTFLQRGFDQVVHDVALQGLPVRFAIDRAGLVGQDGPTHAGAYDLGYMSMLPGMVVMAPADAAELRRMLATAIAHDQGPIALRYPRGEAAGIDQPGESRPLAIGKGRLLREGIDVAILSLGARLSAAMAAAEQLEAEGISVTIADARFCKPLDTELIEGLARHHGLLVSLEDGAAGGFSAHVLRHLAEHDLLARTRFRALTLPDRQVAHGSPAEQYADAGLDANGIATAIRSTLRGSH
ncbi:1-deoxy-D-xylulose-5-phosphate synthase [Aestuariivirga sp.]|jgi:1-deoxy-D-xylulose-5-phosphate synthase|uniref:1-deoxy-D-xylulose-5-phosphate synthase n=1 Tax=Aestuariivirga sp. TaxID=2650926 RepID=UPI0037848735